MRILQIVNSLTHTSIPIEMACNMLNTEEIEIVALYNDQAEADQFAKDMGIECPIYGFGYRNSKIAGLKNYIHFLKHCNYDVINTHHSLSGSLARLICYKKGIKLVHTVHANYHSYSRSQNLIIGSTLNRTDAVVFNSNSSQEGLYEWEKRRIRNVYKQVIYNGVNVERIQNATDDFWQHLCANSGIHDDDIVITQIGRLEPVKNPLGSLTAFDLLRDLLDEDVYKRCRLVIVGDGSERKTLTTYVAEHNLEETVFMPGVIKRDEVYSWMKRADVLIIPSFFEGFCNTLIEGLISKMTICISDIPVFDEILDKSIEVSRFNPNDNRDIAIGLKKSIEEITKDHGSNSEFAKNRFSLNRTIESYLRLYKDL